MSNSCAACLTQPVSPEEIVHLIESEVEDLEGKFHPGSCIGHTIYAQKAGNAPKLIHFFTTKSAGVDLHPSLKDVRTVIHFPATPLGVKFAKLVTNAYGGFYLPSLDVDEDAVFERIPGAENSLISALEALQAEDLAECLQKIESEATTTWKELFQHLPYFTPTPDPNSDLYVPIALAGKHAAREIYLRHWLDEPQIAAAVQP